MIIFHHNDNDGRCAAAIMAHWARNHGEVPRFAEMDYKDAENPDSVLARFEKGERVAVVDFSFKPPVMRAVEAKALDVIWCDHHVTAKAYGYDGVPGFRDFSEKGLSGCECTWKFCFPGVPVPEAARLLGDYDAWRLLEQPRCFEFYEGLKLENVSPDCGIWHTLLFHQCNEVEQICILGRAAIRYRDMYCGDIAKGYGYETEIDGHRAYAMNLYRFGSKGFNKKFGEYPVCIAYIHDGRKFTVSMYSETVDVGQIAKKFGGGGHKGASGFVCDVLPFRRNES